jgi:serine-type D-Ala-D-Ala carboxypeptidase (penicillin-binding protein 5/6)
MSKSNKTHQLHTWWVWRQWDRVLFLVILSGFFLLIPGQNLEKKHTSVVSLPLIRALSFPTPTPAPYPVNRTSYYPREEVSAQGIIVLDVTSNSTMYARDAEVSLSPASTTKILTSLVAMDTYDLDDVVTIQTVMNNGAMMGLIPGEQITVENLLYGALIQSGNDAAWALAEHFPGGVEKFVHAMNTKAAALHLDHSHFTNPVGFDDPNHKMPAHDLARLASFALTNKTLAKIVAIPQITISDVTHTHFHPLTNVNQLLGKIPGVGGIKTGWTEEAGENLVTLVERNGHKVIIVVLKSTNRFADTAFLIDWIFSNYEWKVFTPPIPH